MIELDAEKVLTIPRRIHAREVVERGFMSNFLFANISGIFGAPKEIIDIINNMQAIEEPKALAPAQVNENTADSLKLNENGDVEIPKEQVIGTASELFGAKIYAQVEDKLKAAVEKIQKEAELTPNSKKMSSKFFRRNSLNRLPMYLWKSQNRIRQRFKKIHAKPAGTQNSGDDRNCCKPRIRRLYNPQSSTCKRTR